MFMILSPAQFEEVISGVVSKKNLGSFATDCKLKVAGRDNSVTM